MWVALRGMRRIFKADVRGNERINKMVKPIVDRSPNTGLDVLSARVGLKHVLGAALGPTDRSKFSKMLPVAQSLLNICMQSATKVVEVQNQAERFTPPVPRGSLSSKAIFGAGGSFCLFPVGFVVWGLVPFAVVLPVPGQFLGPLCVVDR